MRGPKGATLPELMISAGLLLLLSGLFFQAILPALQREDWFANKQSVVTGYVVAKERLARLLRTSLLVPVAEHSVVEGGDVLLVEFYPQNTIATTDFGDMGFLDRRELPTFQTQVRHQIRLDSDGLLLHKTANGEAIGPIWFMGEGAEVTVRQSDDGDRLDFEFQGIHSQSTQPTTHWQNVLTLLVR